MNTQEFSTLAPGERFIHRRETGLKKEFSVVQHDGGTVLAHIKGDPGFRVHFYPQQADQLTRVEAVDSPEPTTRSQGIPTLPSAPLGTPKRISVALDGVLSEARPSSTDIGDPNPGAVDFLSAAREAGFRVTIASARDPRSVRRWLQVFGGDHLVEDTEVIRVDEFDFYLLPNCLRYEDKFPPVEELQDMSPSER
jgi:hypothetical protein